jgi:hypothetical protein
MLNGVPDPVRCVFFFEKVVRCVQSSLLTAAHNKFLKFHGSVDADNTG